MLVKTPYGQRLMSMRDYDNYLARIEQEDKAKAAAQEAEKRMRKEEKEKRRAQKREALEEEKAKRKEFIVPQALFGVGNGGDPYMKDKVFPPHLYPHLYPEKFPELFPHIYGDKIKKKQAQERVKKEMEKELLLFRDPRASKVPLARRRQ